MDGITLDQVKVGQEWNAWSERMLGVICAFTVTKVGRKYIHGEFYYGMTTWKAQITPRRLISLRKDV